MITLEQNYKAIEDLVLSEKNPFCISDKSKNQWKEFLHNQRHSEIFKKIAEAPDKRIFLDYDGDMYGEFNRFEETVIYDHEKIKITPKSYKMNKTEDGKKIIKALREYYSDVDNFANYTATYSNLRPSNNAGLLQALPELFPAKCEKYGEQIKKVESLHYDPLEKKISFVVTIEDENGSIHHITFRKAFQPREFKSKCKTLVETICVLINTKIISVKDRKGLKICFSLNYADWLLCSTGNNWTSCLCLDSEYGFWKGLAGLVCDKNRCVAFVTDMKEKEYLGIQSYNMIQRIWLFHFVDCDGNQFIKSNLVYPRKIDFDLSTYLTQIGITLEHKRGCNGKSAYPIPIIWQEEYDEEDEKITFSSSIFEDGFCVRPINIKESVYDTIENRGVYSYKYKLLSKVGFFDNNTYYEIISGSHAYYSRESLTEILS